MKTCPKCNASMPDDVNFCTECGTKVDLRIENETTKICNSCGAQIPREARFCPECCSKQSEDATVGTKEAKNISKSELLQQIANVSSSDARLLIEQYVVHTDIYQKFEEDFIKFKNRTVIVRFSNWELYMQKEILEQKNNLVDWFVYTNNLERYVFLRKNILSLKIWISSLSIAMGKSRSDLIETLSKL